jgi:hypothetical protein
VRPVPGEPALTRRSSSAWWASAARCRSSRYAQACNVPDPLASPDSVRRGVDALAARYAAAGRPHAEIEKTADVTFDAGESVEAFVERCATLAVCGIEYALVVTAGPWTPDAVARLLTARTMLNPL